MASVIAGLLLIVGLWTVGRELDRMRRQAPTRPEPGAGVVEEYVRTGMSVEELERRLDVVFGIGHEHPVFDWMDVT